jgi:threonine/homoserine/homoserine lactone efflux protein
MGSLTVFLGSATMVIFQVDQVLFMLAILTVLAAPGPTNTLFAASGASVGILRSPAGIGGYLFSITSVRRLFSI